MKQRGFTIVELIITITIMAILLALGVVNLTGTQVSARDSERKTDIENISLHLETYYTSGTDNSTVIGRYPSVDALTGLIGHETTLLRDIDKNSLIAPSKTTISLVAATNSVQTTAGVTPQPTIDQYVYQPLQSNGTLCTLASQECRKYNLYYKLEVDSTVHLLTSKNQ